MHSTEQMKSEKCPVITTVMYTWINMIYMMDKYDGWMVTSQLVAKQLVSKPVIVKHG